MSIKETWEAFVKSSLPEDAPELQKEVMKVAFYAAAGRTLNLFYHKLVESLGADDPAILEKFIESELDEVCGFFGVKSLDDLRG